MNRTSRIFLVGFMGSGKTTVGEQLALELGYRFVDLDREIEERRGMTIPELFEKEGESGFRSTETRVLRVVGRRRDIVVATGGGTLTRRENRDFIQESGVTVWLDAPLELMIERCSKGARRPLLSTIDRMKDLLAARVGDYRRCDLRADTSRTTPEEVARWIRARLEKME
jgi:shikimate kinase